MKYLVRFTKGLSTALGLGVTLGLSSMSVAQFGFLQEGPVSGSNFGSNAWTNGFSGALVQLPQFQQSPTSAPQMAPMRRALQLGAYLENTSTGVNIKEVIPGSIAAANGLEAGDTIVAVSGYQVGVVNERVYDAVDEIQKRMDGAGYCNMLVLSRRNGRLINTQLNTSGVSMPVITGQVSVFQAMSVPSGSYLKVELRNMSRPYQQIAGGTQMGSIYGAGPYPFEIHYDPSYIDPRDRYRLFATVSTFQGQTILEGYTDLQAPSGQVQASIQLQRPQVVTAGSITSVGYPPDQNAVLALFRQILLRDPDAGELNAWTNALSRGTTLDGMKAELLASRQFFDMCGNDNAMFAQRLIQAITNRQASQAEVSMVMEKLRLYGNARQLVVRDYLASGPR